jgi:hypothetical protein
VYRTDGRFLRFVHSRWISNESARGRQRQFGVHGRFGAQTFESCPSGSGRNGRQARMGGERQRWGVFQKDCCGQAFSVRNVRFTAGWPDPDTGPLSRLALQESRRFFGRRSRANAVDRCLFTAPREHWSGAAQVLFEGVGAIHQTAFNFGSRIRKGPLCRAVDQPIP